MSGHMGEGLLALPLVSSFMLGRSGPIAGHSLRSHDLVPQIVATAMSDQLSLLWHERYINSNGEQGQARKGRAPRPCRMSAGSHAGTLHATLPPTHRIHAHGQGGWDSAKSTTVNLSALCMSLGLQQLVRHVAE